MTDNPRTILLDRAAAARLFGSQNHHPELAEALLELAKVYERETNDKKGQA